MTDLDHLALNAGLYLCILIFIAALHQPPGAT
ncbi:hypothetical protein FHS53_000448 [Xanthobacter tagetidis]|nr:hypothetical protein [Xanthobacter tagetidis]